MFKASPASLLTFIDTPKCVLEDRVQYSTVHIPNVFCDGHFQIIYCVYCKRHVHRDFLIIDSNKSANKMQQFYKFITWRLCVAQHVSGVSGQTTTNNAPAAAC